jgi:hypothetical protein
MGAEVVVVVVLISDKHEQTGTSTRQYLDQEVGLASDGWIDWPGGGQGQSSGASHHLSQCCQCARGG